MSHEKRRAAAMMSVLLLGVSATSLLVMFLFELTKTSFFPNIGMWTSHTVTIFFTSVIATVAAYVVGRKLALSNVELEARSADILEISRKLAEESRQINILSQMDELFQACRDSEEVDAVVRQYAQQMFPGDAGTLWVISESRNVVEAVASWGCLPLAEHVFAPENCWALRRGKLHVAETPSAVLCRHISANGSFPSLCVPLMAHSETLGLLHIQNGCGVAGRGDTMAPASLESQQRLAAAMAGHVGLALANLKLNAKLRNQSIRDALTGLFNRRYMEESLERELRRAVRNNESIALLMLDLDRFKQFNDTFGHQAGDTLLRRFGVFLKERTRGQDVACRFGGEEFVVILAGASIEGARQRAEALRAEVKQLTVQHAGQVVGAVTLSAGISTYPHNGATAEELLHAADQALYRAKSEGRDKVVLARSGSVRAPSDESPAHRSL